ncbi:hypothetical protein ABRP32_05850 [Providencia manganoxydans]|uniref:hypothetical protein n=1 Tax=Providencia manganoxydans TaxID=2923283 RepID=UPI003AF360E5
MRGQVNAAIDSPIEGASGVIKGFWNIAPDVIDLGYLLAQGIEIGGSKALAPVLGLFSDELENDLNEHAELVKGQLGYSIADPIRFNLSEAEQGGSLIASMTPVGMIKGASRKIVKEVTESSAKQAAKKKCS